MTHSFCNFSAVCFTLCTIVLCLAAFFQLNWSRNVYLLLMASFSGGNCCMFFMMIIPMLLMPAGWQWRISVFTGLSSSPADKGDGHLFLRLSGYNSTVYGDVGASVGRNITLPAFAYALLLNCPSISILWQTQLCPNAAVLLLVLRWCVILVVEQSTSLNVGWFDSLLFAQPSIYAALAMVMIKHGDQDWKTAIRSRRTGPIWAQCANPLGFLSHHGCSSSLEVRVFC